MTQEQIYKFALETAGKLIEKLETEVSLLRTLNASAGRYSISDDHSTKIDGKFVDEIGDEKIKSSSGRPISIREWGNFKKALKTASMQDVEAAAKSLGLTYDELYFKYEAGELLIEDIVARVKEIQDKEWQEILKPDKVVKEGWIVVSNINKNTICIDVNNIFENSDTALNRLHAVLGEKKKYWIVLKITYEE